jgi:DNA-directed RNA polymerase specialized sigma24 family protein
MSTQSEQEDRALMAKIAGGDRVALGELNARWRRRVIGYFRKRTQLNLDFEHLAGLTFGKVARSAPSYISKGRFVNWLFRIARNVLLDEIRRYERERERNGLWVTTGRGSGGREASSACARNAYEDSFRVADSFDDKGSNVVDVSVHTRGVDMSFRFNPRKMRRKGYGVPKEIRSMFRRFGLVDGPTPEIWKKTYANMKKNDSKSAFGGVIAVEGGSSPFLNGASHSVAAELTLPKDKNITTCCVCARRTKCEPVGAGAVCHRCVREAASNWFVARQIAN